MCIRLFSFALTELNSSRKDERESTPKELDLLTIRTARPLYLKEILTIVV